MSILDLANANGYLNICKNSDCEVTLAVLSSLTNFEIDYL